MECKKCATATTLGRPCLKSSSAVVLIVEDDVLARATRAASLRDCGFEVYEAATAAEAVAILNTVAVDALISGINMPGKN